MKLSRIIGKTMLSSALITMGIFTLNWAGDRNNAIAQNSSDCFMVNSQGRRIDLSNLCGSIDSKPTQPSNQPPRASEVRTEPNGTIKIRIKRFRNKIPTVDVVFNGNKTFEMIFDTGASHTLITSEMAKSLSVTPYNYADFSIADGSSVRFPVGEVRSIGIGAFKIQAMPVVIAAKSDIGLLGNDFFGQFDVKIGRSEIELSPRKFF
ncbi:MAG: TIGR02281 family clan AA aspartic protease [Pseudanabaena sp.]